MRLIRHTIIITFSMQIISADETIILQLIWVITFIISHIVTLTSASSIRHLLIDYFHVAFIIWLSLISFSAFDYAFINDITPLICHWLSLFHIGLIYHWHHYYLSLITLIPVFHHYHWCHWLFTPFHFIPLLTYSLLLFSLRWCRLFAIYLMSSMVPLSCWLNICHAWLLPLAMPNIIRRRSFQIDAHSDRLPPSPDSPRHQTSLSLFHCLIAFQ